MEGSHSSYDKAKNLKCVLARLFTLPKLAIQTVAISPCFQVTWHIQMQFNHSIPIYILNITWLCFFHLHNPWSQQPRWQPRCVGPSSNFLKSLEECQLLLLNPRLYVLIRSSVQLAQAGKKFFPFPPCSTEIWWGRICLKFHWRFPTCVKNIWLAQIPIYFNYWKLGWDVFEMFL